MAQSLVKNYIDIIFSTKHRSQLILSPHANELHSYLAGICNNLECHPIKIGGYTDHVHICCMLSKKVTLIHLLESLKSHSSKWMKTRDESLKDFYWQNACLQDRRGYGAFSVNPLQTDTVIKYITNQYEHHQKFTFQDEYRAFLTKYNVDFDERYIWD